MQGGNSTLPTRNNTEIPTDDRNGSYIPLSENMFDVSPDYDKLRKKRRILFHNCVEKTTGCQ